MPPLPSGLGAIIVKMSFSQLCNQLSVKPIYSLAGFHVCAAGWMAKGRVGYPMVRPEPKCGFGKTGIIDYGVRLNRSERWDAYCYNPHGLLKIIIFIFCKKLLYCELVKTK